MFKCKGCESLKEEIQFLREQNKGLTDRLTAIADVRAYSAVSLNSGRVDPKDYYGNEEDEFIEADQFGARMIVKKNTEPEVID